MSMDNNSTVAEVVQVVYDGDCCRVIGPRYRQKTEILRAAKQRLEANGTHDVAYAKLTKLSDYDENIFFAKLLQHIGEELNSDHLLDEADAIQKDTYGINPALTFQHALLHVILDSDRNVALFFDNLESPPPNLIAQLLGGLRAVYNKTVSTGYAPFQAIVCGSLNLSQVAIAHASRFENISKLVFVDEVDPQENLRIAVERCQKAGCEMTPTGQQLLLAETGGDPYLLKALFTIVKERLQDQKQPRLTAEVAQAATQSFCQDVESHWLVMEITSQIARNPSLLSSTLMILDQESVPAADLPLLSDEFPTPLDLCGAFTTRNGAYVFRAPLWRKILAEYLTDERVGELYAMACNWHDALNHLGQASQNDSAIRQNLFTTALNALHASDDSQQEILLAQTLRAAYPNRRIDLFVERGNALCRVNSAETDGPQRLSLDERNQPEIQACSGQRYSILTLDYGTRLLIPLSLNNDADNLLGLVSMLPIQHTDHMGNVQHNRNEVNQLVDFLTQAAQAIEGKKRFGNMLKSADYRAAKQRALNQILTFILQRLEHDEDTIARLFLAGVTVKWGLEFNRAILFHYDQSNHNLIPRHAIGKLEMADAQSTWENFPYNTLDEFLLAVASSPPLYATEPLQQAVADLSFKVDVEAANLLSKCATEQQPFMRWSFQQTKMPSPLTRILGDKLGIALVPLQAGEELLGVLYVDNHFSNRPITIDSFVLLQTFANQISLVLHNNRELTDARRQLKIESDHKTRENWAEMAVGLVHDVNSAVANFEPLVDEMEEYAESGRSILPRIFDLRREAAATTRISGMLEVFVRTKILKLLPCSATELIQQAVQSTQNHRPDHVNIKILPQSELPAVSADPNWIESLLRNLILNAFSAIPVTREGLVTLSASQEHDNIIIRVRDNGEGIAATDRERIFNAGYSTHPDGRRLSGLGLWFCRILAKEHKGRLVLEHSDIGHGSTFKLMLPIIDS